MATTTPGQLFTNTQIPTCIWFLTKSKNPSPASGRGAGEKARGTRKGETLFIDARNLGYMKDRVLRDFASEDIRKIADTFLAWKKGKNVGRVSDSVTRQTASDSSAVAESRTANPTYTLRCGKP